MRQIALYGAVFLLGGLAGFAGQALAGRAAAPAPGIDLSLADGGIYRVRTVVDGDTIVIENGLHVRYMGVNTPELGRFVPDPAPLAVEATERNKQLLAGCQVRLHLSAQTPLDVYGRVVARVLAVPDGGRAEIDIGEILLKEGLAKVLALDLTPPDLRRLKALETEAKAAKAGIWGLEGHSGDSKPYCAATGAELYHLSSCTTAQRIKAASRHEYDSAAHAEQSGLKPCSRCVGK